MANPVHCEDGQWYFYIETWADREGPFEAEYEANLLCKSYAYHLDSGKWYDDTKLDEALEIVFLHFKYSPKREIAGTRRLISYIEAFITVEDD